MAHTSRQGFSCTWCLPRQSYEFQMETTRPESHYPWKVTKSCCNVAAVTFHFWSVPRVDIWICRQAHAWPTLDREASARFEACIPNLHRWSSVSQTVASRFQPGMWTMWSTQLPLVSRSLTCWRNGCSCLVGLDNAKCARLKDWTSRWEHRLLASAVSPNWRSSFGHWCCWATSQDPFDLNHPCIYTRY